MIVDTINRWAELTPNKTAVVQDDVVISYYHFAKIIEATRRFIKPPVMPEDATAVIVITNPLDSWVATLAARSLGYTTFTVYDISIALQARPRNVACVITAPVDAPGVNAHRQHFQGVQLIVIPQIVYGEKNLATIRSFSPSASKPGGHICITSGSTGTPKKIFYSGENEDRRLAAYCSAAGYSASTSLNMLDRTLFSSIGYKYPMAVWSRQGTVLFYVGTRKYRSFRYQGVNAAPMNPLHLQQYLASPDLAENRKLRLELGGGYFGEDLIARAKQAITDDIVVKCGCTEKWIMTFKTPFKRKSDLIWYRPRDPSEVEIVDDNGAPVPDGTVGTLRYRLSDLDPQGYLDEPEATAKAYRDGCFYPGDIAVRREDGRIRLLGRLSDVIVVQGEKLPVMPYEQELQRALGCVSVSLFCTQRDDAWEEIVIALEGQEPAPNRATEIFRQLCPAARAVREFWIPTAPRGAAGKIDRTALRKLAIPN